MKKLGITSASAVLLTAITLPSHAALISVLNGQAYYDDQLDITWTANANINGATNWDNQVAWAAGLDIDGVTGWRLPSMDVNGDDVTVNCSSSSQAACKDNEYGHLNYYGAGTVFGSGITSASSPGPFTNMQSFIYWSSTEFAPDPNYAQGFLFRFGGTNRWDPKGSDLFAWAVHSGNVGAVPIPPALWLFGSGLLGLIGVARKKAT
jgi:hypothetical protein